MTLRSDVSRVEDITTLTVRGVGDLNGIQCLTSLVRLELAGNDQLTELEPIASLSDLRVLELSGESLTDISPTASNTKLAELTLVSTSVEDLSPLVDLAHLNELTVLHSQLECEDSETQRVLGVLADNGVGVVSDCD